jgi:nitrogen fixation protein FixH
MRRHPIPTPQEYELLRKQFNRGPKRGRLQRAMDWMSGRAVDWSRAQWCWTDHQGEFCGLFEDLFAAIQDDPKVDWSDFQTWILKSAPSWNKLSAERWVWDVNTCLAIDKNYPSEWVTAVFRTIPGSHFKKINQYSLAGVVTDALLMSHHDLLDVLLPHVKKRIQTVGSSTKVSMPSINDNVHALVCCRDQASVDKVLGFGGSWWDRHEGRHRENDPWSALSLWLSQQADDVDDGSSGWFDWSHDRRREVLYPNLKKALAESFWTDPTQEKEATRRLGELLLMASETGDVTELKTVDTARLAKRHGVALVSNLALFNPLRVGEFLDWFTNKERQQLERDVFKRRRYTLWDLVMCSGGKGFHWGYDGWSGDRKALKDTLSKLTPQPLVTEKQVRTWVKRMTRIYLNHRGKFTRTEELHMRHPFKMFTRFVGERHDVKSAREQARWVVFYMNRRVREGRWNQDTYAREIRNVAKHVETLWATWNKEDIERFIESKHFIDPDDLYKVNALIDVDVLLNGASALKKETPLVLAKTEDAKRLQEEVKSALHVMRIAEDIKVENVKKLGKSSIQSVIELLFDAQPKATLLNELLDMLKKGRTSSVRIRALLSDPKWIKVWDGKGLLTEANFLAVLVRGGINTNALKEKSMFSVVVESALAEVVKLEEWLALRARVDKRMDAKSTPGSYSTDVLDAL